MMGTGILVQALTNLTLAIKYLKSKIQSIKIKISDLPETMDLL